MSSRRMKLKKWLVFSCALSGIVSIALAGELKDVLNESKACRYKGTNGATLPYRLFSPKVTPGRKYPLLVFLHGAGERGTNNVEQLRHLSALRLVYDKCADGVWRQEARQAFVIFPQCAPSSQWVLVPWGEKTSRAKPEQPSPGMQNVHELVQKLKRELPIDAERLYVTGLSMGGYGTWDYLARWPAEVAAAIVVCGGADDAGIAADPAVSRIPVRIYHGSVDAAVPVERGRSAFAAICTTNALATYVEYGKQGHGIWNRAYSEPGLGDWLFSRRKAPPAPPELSPRSTNPQSTDGKEGGS